MKEKKRGGEAKKSGKSAELAGCSEVLVLVILPCGLARLGEILFVTLLRRKSMPLIFLDIGR
jgi:hypothetical protein